MAPRTTTTSSSRQSRQSPSRNASVTPSPTDGNDNENEPSLSRLSKDSEGYPSWLPKRPPPPAPASTLQSSIIGALHDSSPSPVDPTPFVGGRKPTPRSVRIVSLQDNYPGGPSGEARFAREPTDQTRVGVNAPPKVWTRSSGVPPTAFNASEQDEFLPLPQPRFNAKNLHIQILRSPSNWMRLYFYLWPFVVFYHIPLQTFFDFNAVFILLQVAKFPNPGGSGKNWALGAAAYIASWLVWIFIVCILYELIYSFFRRWRLRRPLMLPIYLSSPAFSYASLTSYDTFSFLQHIRWSGFFPEPTPPLAPSSPSSQQEYDLDASSFQDEFYSWKSGLAETFYFYSQNLPTVALLLPRAGLCLALLFQFSSPAAQLGFLSSGSSVSRRDETFFRNDGSLTDYARGVLIANAAWTGWRILVLIFSWFGLWILSNQRLGGLCGPRHGWEESSQEKTRSVYSEAASEWGAYQGNFYSSGDGAMEYGGDELPWEWREATRMRVQDAFEICLTARARRGLNSGIGLRWSTASAGGPAGTTAPVGSPPSAWAYRDRRYRRHSRHYSKGKEPSTEKPPAETGDGDSSEQFEGLERVLAAVGFPSVPSPARRPVLSEDLFTGPAAVSSSTQPPTEDRDRPTIIPLQYEQPKASSGMFTGLEAPQVAKRNSKDKVPGSSTGPLMTLPYPFSKPGVGHVSSKDLIPFPAAGPSTKKVGSKKSSSSGSSSNKSKSSKSESGTSSGTGSVDEGEDGDDDDEEEEEEEDDEEDDEDVLSSEGPATSSGRASESMSSLGQPISSPARYPFGTRRPVGAGHGRSMSGVSGMSSLGQGGGTMSGGSYSHGHSHSISSHGTRSGGVSVLTHSTGNAETTDSEFGVLEGGARERARSAIPMPPRHPHPHQGRGRVSTIPSSSATAATAAVHYQLQHTLVAFPSVHERQRVDSGRGILVDPAILYGEGMDSDMEDQHELNDDDLDELEDDDEQHLEGEEGEHEDHVGLLGVPTSPRQSLLGGLTSRSHISLAQSQSSSSGHESGLGGPRSHHSSFSANSSNSRSRHSSTRQRTRSRPHSTHSPSVRERASSLGASMRSVMQGAAASLTQLDLVMRGATGPAAGLGNRSRPRSRVNSSMARLEEDVVYSPDATELAERTRVGSGSSGGSDGSGSGEVLPRHMAVAALRQSLEEGYSSSNGTHSRSGSESINAEYTFGRPIRPLMRTHEEQQRERVVEEEEIVVSERSNGGTGTASQGSPSRTRATSIANPQSFVSESFYSQPTIPTVSPSSTHIQGTSLGAIPSSPSPPASSDDHSPERQGIDIPWNQQQRLLSPPTQHWLNPAHIQQRPHDATSESLPDISTVAGSFVTAPATIDGATTTTESSGGRTVPSSWDGTAPGIAFRMSDTGGMVERPGDDMGATGGAWRVI